MNRLGTGINIFIENNCSLCPYSEHDGIYRRCYALEDIESSSGDNYYIKKIIGVDKVEENTQCKTLDRLSC